MQVRAELCKVAQTPFLWFQSFQGVNCLWRISIIYTFQENYISRNICIRVIKLESAMQSHAYCISHTYLKQPSSVLTFTSLTPLTSAETCWLQVSKFSSVDLICTWFTYPIGYTTMNPHVKCGLRTSVPPLSAGIKNDVWWHAFFLGLA